VVNILFALILTVSELHIQTGVMKKRRPSGNCNNEKRLLATGLSFMAALSIFSAFSLFERVYYKLLFLIVVNAIVVSTYETHTVVTI